MEDSQTRLSENKLNKVIIQSWDILNTLRIKYAWRNATAKQQENAISISSPAMSMFEIENWTPSTTKSRDLWAFLLWLKDKKTINLRFLVRRQLDNCTRSSPAPNQSTRWKSFETQTHNDSSAFRNTLWKLSLSIISGPGTAKARLGRSNHGRPFLSKSFIPNHALERRRALLLLMRLRLYTCTSCLPMSGERV